MADARAVALLTERPVPPAMADARAAACLAVLTDAADHADQRDKPPRRAVVGGGAPIVRERRRAVWQEMVCNCESRGDPHWHASPKPRGTYTVAGREGAGACTHLHPLGLGFLVGRPHLRGSPIPPRLSLELRLPLSLLSPSFPRSFSLTHSRRLPRSFSLTHSRRLSTHSRRHSLSKRSIKRWPSKRTRRRHQRLHMGPDGSLDAVDGAVSTEWMSVPRATRACARTSNAGASRV